MLKMPSFFEQEDCIINKGVCEGWNPHDESF